MWKVFDHQYSSIANITQHYWCVSEKEVAPFPTCWCRSYWKGNLRVPLWLQLSTYWCVSKKLPKNGHKWRRKKCSFTVSQVDRNDSKTTWIPFRITSALTLCSRYDHQWLLAVCRLQKNAPGKKIWLQWGRDIGN